MVKKRKGRFRYASVPMEHRYEAFPRPMSPSDCRGYQPLQEKSACSSLPRIFT